MESKQNMEKIIIEIFLSYNRCRDTSGQPWIGGELLFKFWLKLTQAEPTMKICELSLGKLAFVLFYLSLFLNVHTIGADWEINKGLDVINRTADFSWSLEV